MPIYGIDHDTLKNLYVKSDGVKEFISKYVEYIIDRQAKRVGIVYKTEDAMVFREVIRESLKKFLRNNSILLRQSGHL
jgi:hypothetical protein